MQVLFRDARLRPLERRRQHHLERLVRRLDRNDLELNAKVLRQLLRVLDAPLGRVARRHAHPVHVLRPNRIHRDRRDEARVDTAGQRQHGFLEPRLSQIVPRPQHQRLVHLRLALRLRRDTRRHRQFVWQKGRITQHEVLYPFPLFPVPCSLFQLQVADEELFLEHRRSRDQLSRGSQHHRPPVEHQLVLPADLVGIADPHVVGARPL